MYKHNQLSPEAQGHQAQARLVTDLCYIFLKPLLNKLNQGLDRRLVDTFLETIRVLIAHRHRNQGLVLSELGGYLASPSQAPAGTKRLSRLLRSRRWQLVSIDERACSLRRGSLANCLCSCPTLAGGNDVPLQQERTRL